jgi:tRNA(Arg) A34 adenosine deaminase TadA
MQEKFMKRAIELSRLHMQAGDGGPFGAVLVKDGKIVGEGWNCVTSTNDPTAHAEVVAIRNACKNIENFELQDVDLYTSCEPCPMCLSAAYWARVRNIFYASTRQDAARHKFDDEFIYQEIPLKIEDRAIPMKQILQSEAYEVFKEWDLKENKIPY